MAEPCGIPALDWRQDYSGALGMDDGLGSRMGRLRALGNGQVPQCAAEAWRILSRELCPAELSE